MYTRTKSYDVLALLEWGYIWGAGRTYKRTYSAPFYQYTKSDRSTFQQRHSYPPKINSFETSKKFYPKQKSWDLVYGERWANGQVDFVRGELGRYAAFQHGIPYAPSGADWYVQAEAQQQLWSNAASPEFPLGVFLGELAETLQYVRKPLQGLRKLQEDLLDLSKRRIKQHRKYRKNLAAWRSARPKILRRTARNQAARARALKKHAQRRPKVPREIQHMKHQELRDLHSCLSSTWLEYRYAAMPLILSAQEAAKALAERTKRSIHLYRGFSRNFGEWQKVGGGTLSPYGANLKLAYDVYERHTVAYSCGLYARNHVNARAVRTSQKVGMHLYNLPGIAWELTTLSFVVDWFIGLGDFLNTLAPPDGYDFLSGWTTEIVETERLITNWRVTNASNYWKPPRVFVDDYRYTWRILHRKPGVPDKPGFPLLRLGLSWKRALDAFALFVKS